MMTPTQAKKNYACREDDGEISVVFIFKSIKFDFIPPLVSLNHSYFRWWFGACLL